MVTFAEPFKYADVIVIAIGVVALTIAYRFSLRLPQGLRIAIVTAAIVGSIPLNAARTRSDSWREFLLVGAMVMSVCGASGVLGSWWVARRHPMAQPAGRNKRSSAFRS